MNTKDDWLTTCTIDDEHRAAVWGSIFPAARVPIKSIFPSIADLPGHPGARVYFLDLDVITDEQREKLIEMIAGLFSLSEEAVRSDFDRGIPILADDTSVSSRDQGLLFSMMDDDEALDRRLSKLYEDEEGIGWLEDGMDDEEVPYD
jgi:hypothetical protein